MSNFVHQIWAVVPFKKLELCNSRLSSILSLKERKQLACIMFEEVLKNLTRSHFLGGVLVAASDRWARQIAHKWGAQCLQNNQDKGLSSSLTLASEFLKERSVKGIIAVHADLPYLTTENILPVILSINQTPAVSIVSAEGDHGTNILAMSPPGIISYSYGEKSALRHIAAARSVGIEPASIDSQELSFDLDTPNDLFQYLSKPSDTKCYRYLMETGVGSRVIGESTAKMSAQIGGRR